MVYAKFIELFKEGLVSKMSRATTILAEMQPGDRAGFIDRMTTSEYLNARSHAIRLSAEFRRPNAEAVARAFLTDPNWSLRMEALTVLVQHPPPDLPDLLVRTLVHDDDEMVRSLAAFRLGRFARAADLPIMTERMACDKGADHEGNPIRNILSCSIREARTRLGLDE